MTFASETFMAEKYQTRPRERLGAYLRQRYGVENRDKRLARDIQTSAKTARNLFEDHWPSDVTWGAIVSRFGRDVLAAVFEPDIDPVLARLAAEERELKERLNAVTARRLQAQGSLVGDQEPLASVEAEKDTLTLDLFEGRV